MFCFVLFNRFCISCASSSHFQVFFFYHLVFQLLVDLIFAFLLCQALVLESSHIFLGTISFYGHVVDRISVPWANQCDLDSYFGNVCAISGTKNDIFGDKYPARGCWLVTLHMIIEGSTMHAFTAPTGTFPIPFTDRVWF